MQMLFAFGSNWVAATPLTSLPWLLHSWKGLSLRVELLSKWNRNCCVVGARDLSQRSDIQLWPSWFWLLTLSSGVRDESTEADPVVQR